MLDMEILYKTKCLECGKEIDVVYIGGQVDQHCTCCSGFFCREHLKYYKNYLHCKKCIYDRERGFKRRPQETLTNMTVEKLFEKGIIWDIKMSSTEKKIINDKIEMLAKRREKFMINEISCNKCGNDKFIIRESTLGALYIICSECEKSEVFSENATVKEISSTLKEEKLQKKQTNSLK